MSTGTPQRTIRMKGTGTATADCDEAVVSGGVKAVRQSVLEASQLCSVASKDVHAALAQLDGLSERDVATTNISVRTEYDYGPNGRQGPPRYAVHQGLSLRMRGATGDAVAAAVNVMVQAAGDALELSSVSFQVSEAVRVQLLEVARRAAAADATEKAKLYAQALGMQAGGVLEVWEEGAGPPVPRPRAQCDNGGAEMAMGKAMACPPAYGGAVSMGESCLTAGVWVMFELLPGGEQGGADARE